VVLVLVWLVFCTSLDHGLAVSGWEIAALVVGVPVLHGLALVGAFSMGLIALPLLVYHPCNSSSPALLAPWWLAWNAESTERARKSGSVPSGISNRT
jgi:hypothetical protein